MCLHSRPMRFIQRWVAREHRIAVHPHRACQLRLQMMLRHRSPPTGTLGAVQFRSSILEPMTSMGARRRVVKGNRPYDATLRRERARQKQERVIEAAERRFLSDGYGTTTIAAIADDAGVSVDTIYKSFGGKPGLVRSIRERALRGSGPVPAEQRSDDLQVRQQDPRKIIEAWGHLTIEVAPRTAPILLLVRNAATTDPELQALLEEMDADRLRRMT